jgi:hypothetical protein
MHDSMKRFLTLPALALLALLAAAAPAQAAVQTVLSAPMTQVGAPVQLQYVFINTEAPKDMPRSLMVDGLDIRLTGTSRRVEMVNFQTTSSLFYAYTVVPNRPGDFTIPGFAVQTGGQQIRTDAVNLRVAGTGGFAPPPGPGGAPQVMPPPRPQRQQGGAVPRSRSGEAAQYYGELIMGAKSAFVGEVVPVELRFYFRADAQFDNLQRPTFAGDGFTAAPLSEPEQTEQYIDDTPYNVVTFRSAITPVKTGQIEIPAAVMEGRMMVAAAPQGIDPFFDQFFQNMPGFGRAENIEARTSARQLEVQPLPKEGRPESFAGAIGQFTMAASASPKTAQAGEPVSLKLIVEGRGNFDAITPPVLTGADGWRTYAPKESFKGADTIGYGGKKTFEISMVARSEQKATPGAEFSYFDPLKEKYFTLKADPVPVSAAGSSTPAAPADDASTATAQASATPGQTPSAPAAAEAAGIGEPAAQLSARASGFHPWINSPWFRILNLALLTAVIFSIPLLVWLRRRSQKSAQTAALEAALRKARVGWEQAAERSTFYSEAAQFVVARLALWDDRPLALVNPGEALARRVADPLERRELESVLACRDELTYGGGGGGALDPIERRRVAELLEKFARYHA